MLQQLILSELLLKFRYVRAVVAAIVVCIFCSWTVPQRGYSNSVDFEDGTDCSAFHVNEDQAFTAKLQQQINGSALSLSSNELGEKHWQIIESMPNLEKINLSGCTPADFERLARLKRLRTLVLTNNKVTFAELSKVSKLRSVVELSFNYNGNMDADHQFNLAPFPSVIVLGLSGPADSSIDISPLLEFAGQLHTLRIYSPISHQSVLGKLVNLRELALWFPKVDEEGSKAIGSLEKLQKLTLGASKLDACFYVALSNQKSLEQLEFHNSNIPGFAFEHLAQISSLKSLLVSDGTYSDADLCPLGKLRSLRVLMFSGGNQLTGSFLRKFQEVPIERLELNGENLSEEGMHAIADLRSLQWLQVDQAPYTFPAQWGSKLARLQNLHAIYIACPRYGADEWSAELSHGPKISGLRLGNSDLTDRGIAQMQPMPNLEALTVSGTSVSGASIKIVANKFPSLKYLDLSGCNIGDSALADLKPLMNLKTLNIEKANITDAGLHHLKNFPNMESLKLGGNSITGVGLDELTGMPKLVTLDLRETLIASATLSKLCATNITSLDISDTEVNEHAVPFLKSLHNLQNLKKDGCGFIGRKSPLQCARDKRVKHFWYKVGGPITHRDCPPPLRKKEKMWKELADERYSYDHANILMQLGRYPDALVYLDREMNARPYLQTDGCGSSVRGWQRGNYDCLVSRAHCHNALKNYELALKDASAAIFLNRLSAYARKESGYAKLHLGRFREAIADLTRAMEIDPELASAYHYRSLALAKLGEPYEGDAASARRLRFVADYPSAF